MLNNLKQNVRQQVANDINERTSSRRRTIGKTLQPTSNISQRQTDGFQVKIPNLETNRRVEQRESLLQRVFEQTEHVGSTKLARNLMRTGFVSPFKDEFTPSPNQAFSSSMNQGFSTFSNPQFSQLPKTGLISPKKQGFASPARRVVTTPSYRSQVESQSLLKQMSTPKNYVKIISEKDTTQPISQETIAAKLNTFLQQKTKELAQLKEETKTGQAEGILRRPSLIETQIQEVFEDSKSKRYKAGSPRESAAVGKEFSSKKSMFATAAAGFTAGIVHNKSISSPQNIKIVAEHNHNRSSDQKNNSIECGKFSANKSFQNGQNSENMTHLSSSTLKKSSDSLAEIPHGLFSSSSKRTLGSESASSFPNINKFEESFKPSSSKPIIAPLIPLSEIPKQPQGGSLDHGEESKYQFLNSDQIMKEFFPDMVTNSKVPESLEKKTEQMIKQKKKRMEQYDQIFMELRNKRKTFAKFAFKSYEKQENGSIRSVLEDLAEGDPNGTMGVIDLWSDKNINKFLGNCKLIKDKLMISKIAAIKKRRGFFLDESKPFLLSRKDELNLINKVYMSEQSKQFSEKYSNQLKKTMQNPLDSSAKAQLNQQAIVSKKLSENRQIKRMATFKPLKTTQPVKKEGGSLISLSDSSSDSEAELKITNNYYVPNNVKNGNNSDEQLPQKRVLFNDFLRSQNIVKSTNQYSPPDTMSKTFTAGSASKDYSVIMAKMLKINTNIIKDLDVLRENDNDYEHLVDSINTLQDKIVQQKISNFEPSNSALPNDY